MPALLKVTHICPWEAPLPLAVKRHRLNTDPEEMLDDTPETAFNSCLCMSPGVDGELFGAAFSQKLSPKLEPLPFLVAGEMLLPEPDEGPSFMQEPAGSSFTGTEHASVSSGQGPIESRHITQLASHQSVGMQASLAALEVESHTTCLA
jgi:hypothetical protein